PTPRSVAGERTPADLQLPHGRDIDATAIPIASIATIGPPIRHVTRPRAGTVAADRGVTRYGTLVHVNQAPRHVEAAPRRCAASVAVRIEVAIILLDVVPTTALAADRIVPGHDALVEGQSAAGDIEAAPQPVAPASAVGCVPGHGDVVEG